MRIPSFLILASIVLLLLSLPGWPARTVHGLDQPVSLVQISPVASCCRFTNDFFTVSVMLILPAGESINGFDIRINYTNANTPANHGVLQANSISYSSNLFGSASSTVLVDCIDGTAVQGSGGCPSDDAPLGQVHLSEVITGQTVQGPGSGVLFTIRFQITGYGVSLFTIDRANLVNPHPDPSNPQLINPVLIPVVKQDAIFGNQGVVSFFNYQPVDTSVTPSIIPNQPIGFDASASFLGFNGSSVGFRKYSWDFGDGTGGVGSTITHPFTAVANFTVTLTVWDAANETGTIVRKVDVLPALGSLSLTVKDQIGTVLRANVNVRVFNSSSSTTPFVTKTIDNAGGIQFSGLTPGGSYYLRFSGDTVENYSKTELVQPGLTTYDTVYMTLRPPPPDYGGLIYLGTIGGGLAIVTAAIVYKLRKDSKKSRLQTRKSKTKN